MYCFFRVKQYLFKQCGERSQRNVACAKNIAKFYLSIEAICILQKKFHLILFCNKPKMNKPKYEFHIFDTKYLIQYFWFNVNWIGISKKTQ